jgi:excisionase family DNA binding protein
VTGDRLVEWTSRFETDLRGDDVDEDLVDELMGELAAVHGAVGTSPMRRVTLTVSYPAAALRAALVTGEGLVRSALDAAGARTVELVGADVMTSEDFDAQLGEDLPDVMGSKEAAEMLMVSDVAVRAMVDRGDLPARRAGTVWVIRRDIVEAMAAARREAAAAS